MPKALSLHPDRLLPADPTTRGIARGLYESVATLPIVSPHGHTDPAWFATDSAWTNPAELLLAPLCLARLDPRLADSGNAGQLDLVLALQWIRDNIANFGGNPGRVMVFGQSGGGAKIATLMGMPAAHGLFHGAITMSGRQVTASGPLNATARSRAYLAALGDPTIDTLLTMPVERLVEGLSATDPVLGGSVYFGPVLDMKWLDRHPFWPIANPQSNHIPMILGNTRDETRAFIDPDSERVRTLSWDNIAERMAPELRMDSSPEWLVVRYREQIPDWSPERGSSMPRPPPAEAGPARCSRPRRGPAPARSPGFTSSTSSRRPSRAAALRGPGAGHRRLRQGTRTAVQLAQAAERAGADGLLLLPPYLVNSNQDGLSAHRVGDIELMTRIFARMGDRLTYIGGLPTPRPSRCPISKWGSRPIRRRSSTSCRTGPCPSTPRCARRTGRR